MGVDSALLREMLMTPQIFLLAGLMIAVFTDPYLSFKHKIIMQVIAILARELGISEYEVRKRGHEAWMLDHEAAVR